MAIVYAVKKAAASDADDRHIPEKERALTFEMLQLIGNALDDHGTPPELADRLLNNAAAQAAGDPHMALAGALDAIFQFLPLPEEGKQPRPIMLIGPPGGGKTSAVAKMAARIADHRLLSTTTGVSSRSVRNGTRRSVLVEQPPKPEVVKTSAPALKNS